MRGCGINTRSSISSPLRAKRCIIRKINGKFQACADNGSLFPGDEAKLRP